MRKFIIHSKKEEISVMEVECEKVQPVDDPSVMWLPADEYRARVLLPTTFHQKHESLVEGKKVVTMVPDVWHSHALYDSLDLAVWQASILIRFELETNLCKNGTAFDLETVNDAILAIKIVRL